MRLASYKLGKNRVQLQIKDVFRQADRLYIRYTVDNTTKRAYEVGKPQVFFLEQPQARTTLVGRREWQLTDSEAERIDSKEQRPLEVIDQEVRSARVEPSEGDGGCGRCEAAERWPRAVCPAASLAELQAGSGHSHSGPLVLPQVEWPEKDLWVAESP